MNKNETAPPENVPLTVNAYNTIKQQIIDLHLKPGEIILAQNLAKSLGISRTPVREALVRLAQEGLVEPADGRKFKITEITLESVMELYEIREALEVTAIWGVTKRATKEIRSTLKKLLDDMKAALEGRDYDTFFNLDLEFHSYIVEQHGNKTMMKMLDLIHDRVQRVRYLTINIEGRVSHTVDEHTLIYNAVVKGDSSAAVDAIRNHFNNCEVDFSNIAEKMNGSTFLWKTLINV